MGHIFGFVTNIVFHILLLKLFHNSWIISDWHLLTADNGLIPQCIHCYPKVFPLTQLHVSWVENQHLRLILQSPYLYMSLIIFFYVLLSKFSLWFCRVAICFQDNVLSIVKLYPVEHIFTEQLIMRLLSPYWMFKNGFHHDYMVLWSWLMQSFHKTYDWNIYGIFRIPIARKALNYYRVVKYQNRVDWSTWWCLHTPKALWWDTQSSP